VGKTRLSLDLAARFGAEIINADSMQVYRYMDIGTARPLLKNGLWPPITIIDIVNPDQDFDAARLPAAGPALIADLERAGRRDQSWSAARDCTCGACSTGCFPGRPGPALRSGSGTKPPGWAGRPCTGAGRSDPDSAARLHPRDLVRVGRGPGVFELTGRPISAFPAP
jgi:tRNA dimethylallyltransferase